MRRSRAMILGVAAALILSACVSGNDDGASDEPATIGVRTGEPTQAIDSLTWYTFYRPVLGLVAATWVDYPELMVNANLCESVVRVEPDFSIVPGLADFTVSDDFTTYTYTIREGARFWDGTPVTPEDVIFSITANTTPPFGASNFQIAELIESMTATDDRTVTIQLTQPEINFNGLMAGTSGKVYQQAQAEQAGENWGAPGTGVMCTGPYTLGEWDPATSLTIVANGDYWSDDFAPLVEEIVFTFPQDPTTLSNAFQTGEIMGGWNVPPSIIPPLGESDAGTIHVGSSTTAMQMYALIVSDVNEGPLADPRMRQAVSMLIDREAIAEKIYNGAADALYTLAPAGSIADADESLTTANDAAATAADAEGARDLIEEAGQAGVELVLALPAGDSLATVTATALQTDAEKAGINLELLPLEPSQYAGLFFDPAAREGVDLFFTIYAPTVRDAVQNYFETLGTGQVNNFNGYSNPAVDELLQTARTATDPAVRAENLLGVQEIYLEELPYIPIAAPRVTLWENADITGAPTTFTWTNSPWAALLGGR